MDNLQLDQMERLQKLRTAGALSELEFQSEKEKLLSVPPAREPGQSWHRYAIIGLLIAAAVAFVIWIKQDVSTQPLPQSHRRAQAALPQPAVNASLPEKPRALSVADAFRAATGHLGTFKQVVDGKVVITKPLRLVRCLLDRPFSPSV